MDFEKTFPIAQRSGERILVRWTRGFQRVELYFQDTKIGFVDDGFQKLKKGFKVQTEIGLVELTLSEDPITINVILDGFHSPVNISHPVQQLAKSASYFWIIFTFAIIGSIVEGLQVSGLMFGIVISINIIIAAVYLISAIYVGKAKPWAFYLGFSMYCFMSLLALLSLFVGSFFIYIVLIIRAIFLYFLITNIKHAASTYRHNLIITKSSSDLLDV